MTPTRSKGASLGKAAIVTRAVFRGDDQRIWVVQVSDVSGERISQTVLPRPSEVRRTYVMVHIAKLARP